MGKLYVLIGKSASGKDTLAEALLRKFEGRIGKVIPYTTRPIRIDEKNGVQYWYVSYRKMEEMEREGKILERREYHTVRGDWYYFTADDGQIDLANRSALMVGTPEAYAGLVKALGQEKVVPILVVLDDEERLMRAIWREKQQKYPNFAEVCRRYLADEKDYSAEIVDAIVTDPKHRLYNWDFDTCLEQAVSLFENMLAEE